MARGGRRNRTAHAKGERGLPDDLFLKRPLTSPLLRPFAYPSTLLDIEDRRTYHPLGPVRAARATSGHPVKPNVVRKSRPYRSPFFLSPQIKFADPRKTVICVRRAQRKEVLHALRKTGRGSGRSRKRRNIYSEVTC